MNEKQLPVVGEVGVGGIGGSVGEGTAKIDRLFS